MFFTSYNSHMSELKVFSYLLDDTPDFKSDKNAITKIDNWQKNMDKGISELPEW